MNKLYEIVDDLKSPLFRIMSVYNVTNISTRQFMNNISCFHIGKGLFLSVSHNLRTKGIPNVIDESEFQSSVLSKVQMDDKKLINKHYILNTSDNKRHISNVPGDFNKQVGLSNDLKTIFQKIQFDTSFEKDYARGTAKPFLIVQFKTNDFFGDKTLTSKFKSHEMFHEPSLNRYTFLLEVEIVKSFYSSDICVYKIKNADSELISKIPAIELDFTLHNNLSNVDFFCLQSSPSSELGRMLNTAKIDGIAEHWTNFSDLIHTNYILEGKRYITRNYFRFGSSGAPYIIYDKEKETAFVNAVQSEACPIQMTINNSRDGNAQYTHAIATPLSEIENELKALI
jgi:hypothetical protein